MLHLSEFMTMVDQDSRTVNVLKVNTAPKALFNLNLVNQELMVLAKVFQHASSVILVKHVLAQD
jgi:hypothetical protein